MKKTLAILIMFALIASVAFADVTVGAWGRGLFTPVSNSGGDDMYADTSISWESMPGAGAWGAPRVGMTISGSSDNVGFQADFNVDNKGVNTGDQQKIWVTPMEGLTVSMGVVYDDTLRGNSAFGGFNWLRAAGNAGTGEDNIFRRARTDDFYKLGTMLAYHANGIHAVVSLGAMDSEAAGETTTTTDMDPTSPTYGEVTSETTGGGFVPVTIEDMAGNGTYQLGYDIEGIGTVRAQAQSRADDSGMYQVAFKLTAVEGLYADLGVQIPQNSDALDGGSYYDTMINAY
ncbi:MAG: hypothetical protein PF450_08830, partial [Bacteroidales bacterium]|nr:hypothetical protein [Bacteroidales bacterium]